MSLIRKAQSKIAHNTSFPSLGNRDLKDLQDLINSDKTFVAANNKAAAEFQKNANALRAWGSSEGDDFADVMPKVALLYESYSRAQVRFNYFVSTMRLHLKSIRAREEHFAELKNRKRALQSKIESVEKKLSRMGPENRDLAKVTGSLKEMRSDMEVMRNELISEDAAISDFKRRTIVEAIGLKAGGLMEMAEKSIVIAESMRLLIDEIPQVATTPGQPRIPYRSEARTDHIIQEAVQQLESIRFAPRQDPMALGNEFASPVAPSYRDRATNIQTSGYSSADISRQGNVSAENIPVNDAHGSQGWVSQLPDEMQGQSDVLSTVQEEHQSDMPHISEMERVTSATVIPQGDYGLDDADDAIPGLPPVDPSYPVHTPLSGNSHYNNYDEHNRAYFEGVGGTKALQAAAARSTSGFPTLERLDLNSTPGMFANDVNGRSLSPSALQQTQPSMGMAQARGLQLRGTPELHNYNGQQPQYDVDPKYIQAYDQGYPQTFPEVQGYDDYATSQRYIYGDEGQAYAKPISNPQQGAPEHFGQGQQEASSGVQNGAPQSVPQSAPQSAPQSTSQGVSQGAPHGISGNYAFPDTQGEAPPYEPAGHAQAAQNSSAFAPSNEQQTQQQQEASSSAPAPQTAPALAPPFMIGSLQQDITKQNESTSTSAPAAQAAAAATPAAPIASINGLPPYLSYNRA
ncbi:hypothetical protein MCUN1_002956 [Malassezia cuniculi]|uniref:Eisosome component PIL1-domain-containing protein n=1 Tax=Malassezia cuniculi TaxID=948313 RepID=A0AAF0ESS4_9BASI|nr:hypothetical protein MCUN1_002956 [Malassezia cuniculi]